MVSAAEIAWLARKSPYAGLDLDQKIADNVNGFCRSSHAAIPGVGKGLGEAFSHCGWPMPPQGWLKRPAPKRREYLEEDFSCPFAALVHEMRLRVMTFVDRLQQLAELLGPAALQDFNARIDQIDAFYFLIHLQGWAALTTQWKYQKDYLFSRYELSDQGRTSVEGPTRGSSVQGRDGALLLGEADRLLRRRLSQQDRRGRVWRNTVLQGVKKMMPPVTIWEVEAALIKNERALTKEPSALTPEVEREVARTCAELFSSSKRGELCLKTLSWKTSRMHSLSSVLGKRRGEGGCVGEIRETMDGSVRDVTPCAFDPLTATSYTVDDERRQYHDLWNAGRLTDFSKPPVVWFRTVLEPGKARIMSLGDAGDNAQLEPVQNWLLKRIQKNPVFALTGGPCDAADLQRLVQKACADPWEETGYTAGDYSAATDGLNIHATQVCALMTADRLDFNRDLILRSVQPARLVYTRESLPPELLQRCPWYHSSLTSRKARLDDDSWIEAQPLQATGQLMGNKLSFPFLCIINAALFRMAWEAYYGEVRSLESLPLLINGDDIAFRSGKGFHDYWRSRLHEVGFTPSPGKNFWSLDFCQINSEYWLMPHNRPTEACEALLCLDLDLQARWERSLVRTVPERVGYVNFGLINFMGKGQVDDNRKAFSANVGAKILSFRPNWDACAEYTTDGLTTRAHALMVRLHADFIVCFDYPLPVRDGGLDLPPCGLVSRGFPWWAPVPAIRTARTGFWAEGHTLGDAWAWAFRTAPTALKRASGELVSDLGGYAWKYHVTSSEEGATARVGGDIERLADLVRVLQERQDPPPWHRAHHSQRLPRRREADDQAAVRVVHEEWSCSPSVCEARCQVYDWEEEYGGRREALEPFVDSTGVLRKPQQIVRRSEMVDKLVDLCLVVDHWSVSTSPMGCVLVPESTVLLDGSLPVERFPRAAGCAPRPVRKRYATVSGKEYDFFRADVRVSVNLLD